jgi:hypothetical protein
MEIIEDHPDYAKELEQIEKHVKHIVKHIDDVRSGAPADISVPELIRDASFFIKNMRSEPVVRYEAVIQKHLTYRHTALESDCFSFDVVDFVKTNEELNLIGHGMSSVNATMIMNDIYSILHSIPTDATRVRFVARITTPSRAYLVVEVTMTDDDLDYYYIKSKTELLQILIPDGIPPPMTSFPTESSLGTFVAWVLSTNHHPTVDGEKYFIGIGLPSDQNHPLIDSIPPPVQSNPSDPL